MRRPTFLTWSQLKVGTLLVFGLGALVAAVVKLGQAANLFGSRYELVTYLPNAAGLLVGGSVQVAGQLAGTVKSIEFLPVDADTMRNLKVIMHVDERLQSQVRADSRVRLKTLGLLGDKVLDITPGTPAYPALQEGATVPLQPGLDYETALVKASLVMDTVVALASDVRQITGGLVKGQGTAGQLLTNRAMYDNMNRALMRAEMLLTSLQNPNGTMGRLLNDPTLYRNLTSAVAGVDSLVVQLNNPDGTMGKLLRDDSLYVRVVGVAISADSLLKTMSSGNGMLGKLMNDQQLYDQLVKLVADLSGVLADVRANPGRYTKGMVKVF
jgi:phospholipid/cholesterol/gamma-HCH transport system substrate-binding protein